MSNDTIFTWNGKRSAEMTREELIDALESSARSRQEMTLEAIRAHQAQWPNHLSAKKENVQ